MPSIVLISSRVFLLDGVQLETCAICCFEDVNVGVGDCKSILLTASTVILWIKLFSLFFQCFYIFIFTTP